MIADVVNAFALLAALAIGRLFSSIAAHRHAARPPGMAAGPIEEK
jgi:hypothetical protein